MAEYIRVARVDEVAPGRGKRVVVGGREIALFNVDGQIYAIDDICSHARASLSEGELDGHVVECPLHGARFDVRTGQALSLPAWRPVATFPVRVEGGEIYVAV